MFVLARAPAGDVSAAPSGEDAQRSSRAAASEMRLGERALTIDDGMRERKAVCRKLRSLVTELGETFVGHKLRAGVLVRACSLTAAESDDDIWDWPWRTGALDRELPPHHHVAVGDWEIRCGHAGRRLRCAMLHVIDLGSIGRADGGRIIVHFVINRVARQETVLWRVFADKVVVGRVGTETVAAGEQQSSPVAFGFKISGAHMVEPFDLCGAAGCMMEAGVRVAAAVATRLSEGETEELTLSGRNRDAIRFNVPAAGFRDGLGNLARLRRAERPLAVGR